jgi:erythromycin esterase-like protein
MCPSLVRRSLRAAFAVVAASLAACGSPNTFPGPRAEPTDSAAATVRAAAVAIAGATGDYDPLMTLVGDARVVFLGESTHGTHEYYRERARITQRLILEKGFTAVAIEGDWPETARVNDWVRGRGSDANVTQALSGYSRFPQWMWANEDIGQFVTWMRAHNASRPAGGKVGLYGLDVYSLGPSSAAVIEYLQGVDPEAADEARRHYRCFAPSGGDPQQYGASLGSRDGRTCEAAGRAVLAMLQRRSATPPADPDARDALYSALRNAHSVVNAEEYFRTLYQGGQSTWNLRDQRMAEGVEALEAHLAGLTGRTPRVVVWAHNTHAGDARHTESAEQGEHNIAQLVRERHGTAAVSVGFFTHRGTVMAADDWDLPARTFTLRPALPGSTCDVLHAAVVRGAPRNFLLVLRGAGAVADTLARGRLQRAVGVVYRPDTERQSHYFLAQLSRQFDAAVFIDSSSAVRPLQR